MTIREINQRLRSMFGKSSGDRTQRRLRDDSYQPSARFAAAWSSADHGNDPEVRIAAAAMPDPAERACLLAALALAGGETGAALEQAAAAVSLRPDFVAAHEVRARTMRVLNRHAEALQSFQRIVELRHNDVPALLGQADTCLALDRLEEARDCFELALAYAPDCVPALVGLARLLRDAGAHESARVHLGRALLAAPGDPALHFESALAHNRSGDGERALKDYQRALELDPQYAAASVNLGLIYLSQLGDAARAQQYFERALASDPASIAAQANLGLALQEQGRIDVALAHYERLIGANPQVVEFRWNRGLALLGAGDYARGWDDYEMRTARGKGGPRAFSYPLWHGEALGDAGLLIYGEQGLGDEIMFASCIPDLLERGIRCVIECDPRLAPLFERSFTGARVHGAARTDGPAWLAAHPEISAQIAIGSIPRLLRRQEREFPRQRGYLHAIPARVAYWRSRLEASVGTRAIGIAWRGGTLKTRDRLRSLATEDVAPLFAATERGWVNLQRGGDAEFAALVAGRGARSLADSAALDDIDETAALIEALDCVITADNTVAHLAGALGKRTLIMLPYTADWRWRREGERCPWYPSAVLCRQSRPGDWSPVVTRVARELQWRRGET